MSAARTTPTYGTTAPVVDGHPASPAAARTPRTGKEAFPLRRWHAVAATISLSVLAFVAVGITDEEDAPRFEASGGGGTKPNHADLSSSAQKALAFTALTDGGYDSVDSYPWTVVEPWKNTTLQATVGGVAVEEECTWSVDGASGLTGAQVQVIFTHLGKADVSLACGQLSKSGEVMVKYVRREVRVLSDNDRERFLDALATVYSVSTMEGRTERGFGSKYKHISYFTKQHLAGAAARDCDHWHDGSGLMVHHMSFTLELEQALQAVDASVSVPYWDYSIDASTYGERWYELSPVFGDEWFGRARDSSDPTHVIANGRWAYTPILEDATSYSNITNGHGLLRSPWNQNPTPFVTRHFKVLNLTQAGYGTFPDCEATFTCFEKTTVAEMNECLNGDTHGPVHVMLGGQWHVSGEQQKLVFHYSIERIQLLLFKNLWRRGFASCDEDCVDGSSCTCSCHTGDADPYTVLADSGLLHWIDEVTDNMVYSHNESKYRLTGMSEVEEADSWHKLLGSLCNPGHVGELYTSNAPSDPLFWPIHTSAERLMGWKRVMSHLGLVKSFDQTWGYSHPSNTPSDPGVVCDWSAVDGTTTTLPTCETKTCSGHNKDDVLPSGNFLDAGESYTNIEFYDFMDPYNEALPYLYDNFNWEACDDQGFAMSSTNFNLAAKLREAGF